MSPDVVCVSIFEVGEHPLFARKPGWWPDCSRTVPGCPLAGLKVVDITRVITAPAMMREHKKTSSLSWRAETLGVDICLVRPVLQCPRGDFNSGFYVGTRSNGVDQLWWLGKLMTQVTK
jgi:hypothetical protein